MPRLVFALAIVAGLVVAAQTVGPRLAPLEPAPPVANQLARVPQAQNAAPAAAIAAAPPAAATVPEVAPAEAQTQEGVAPAPSASFLPSGRPINGTAIESTFYSPTLDATVPYRVYLPPNYAESGQSYPVVYMLHGAGGNYTEWTDSYLFEQLDALVAAGEIRPMIVVTPDGGERTYWANWTGGPQWADYLTQDVVDHIDGTYRTIDNPGGRAIGGLSMGGLGALNAAFHHPEIFGVVGGHSPSIRLAPEPELWFLLGQNFYEHFPQNLVWRRAPRDVTIWLDVGAEDWWRGNIEDLHNELEAARVDHVWNVFPGTHEGIYWVDRTPDYLRFYDAAFEGRDAVALLPSGTRDL
jgi:enterochelin esterase-like enzyme